MKKQIRSLLALSFALIAVLAACAPEMIGGMRAETAKHIALPSFMTERKIPAGPFLLTAWERVRAKGKTANIYIEGDGLAWVSRSRPSNDPTPTNPLALHLASRDDGQNVIYLARPCQYTKLKTGNACDVKYWTAARFAPEIIDAMNAALDDIKAHYSLSGFNLVGYSGGGAVAVLLAGRRDDVLTLRTVAGNIDTETFSTMHGISQLAGSLNPLESAARTAHIPQQHFIGANDKVVTAGLYANFARAAGDRRCIRATLVPGADHETGWVNQWPELLKLPLDCENND